MSLWSLVKQNEDSSERSVSAITHAPLLVVPHGIGDHHIPIVIILILKAIPSYGTESTGVKTFLQSDANDGLIGLPLRIPLSWTALSGQFHLSQAN